jgi:hypothetical protein
MRSTASRGPERAARSQRIRISDESAAERIHPVFTTGGMRRRKAALSVSKVAGLTALRAPRRCTHSGVSLGAVKTNTGAARSGRGSVRRGRRGSRGRAVRLRSTRRLRVTERRRRDAEHRAL